MNNNTSKKGAKSSAQSSSQKNEKVAAPIDNRHRDDELVALGPGCTGIGQGARTGARDQRDVSRQLDVSRLLSGRCAGKRHRDQQGEHEQSRPYAHGAPPSAESNAMGQGRRRD